MSITVRGGGSVGPGDKFRRMVDPEQTVDAHARREVVERAAELIERRYVLPEVGQSDTAEPTSPPHPLVAE